MKLTMATAEWTGANIAHMTPQVRSQETRDGGKQVVLALNSIDPTVDVTLVMSEAEARDLRDNIDKLFPRLTGIKGSKA